MEKENVFLQYSALVPPLPSLPPSFVPYLSNHGVSKTENAPPPSSPPSFASCLRQA